MAFYPRIKLTMNALGSGTGMLSYATVKHFELTENMSIWFGK